MKFYTTEEAAAMLKVTVRTLYNYINSGEIKTAKVGRQHRITEEELENFINRCTKKKEA